MLCTLSKVIPITQRQIAQKTGLSIESVNYLSQRVDKYWICKADTSNKSTKKLN